MSEFLSLEDLLRIVEVAGLGPVRDVGLLESAAHRPQTSLFGQDAYPDLASKAAALLHSLAQNQPLVDGNKRLAWLAMVVLLAVNGHRPRVSDDEGFEVMMAISGGLTDVNVIASRLQVESRPG